MHSFQDLHYSQQQLLPELFFSNSFFDLFVTPLNRLVDDGNQLYHAAKESEVASRESRRL